jgi:hypothetical protein
MDELNIPFDFTNIQGYPHNIPKKAFDKIPTFQRNNVVYTRDHFGTFNNMILKTIWDNTHEDLRMRLLALSLENDVMDWFIHLPTNSISTFP